MEKQPKDKETKQFRTLTPRESDNPIVEEYKDELLKRPTYGPRPVEQLLGSEERLAHMEGLLADLIQRVDSLERVIQILEGKK